MSLFSVNKKFISILTILLLTSCLPFGNKGALRFEESLPGNIGGGNNSKNFSDAKLAMSTACFNCHGDWKNYNESNFLNLKPNNSELNPLIVPGQPDNSWFVKKIKYHAAVLSSSQGQKMPVGTSANAFTLSDYDKIVKWISQMNSGNTDPLQLFKSNVLINNNSSIDLGSIALNTGGSTLVLYLRNNTNASINVSPISLQGDNEFTVAAPIPNSLDAYESASFKIKYSPTAIISNTTNLLISTSIGNLQFKLEGSGSDLLASHGITCTPGQKNQTYDYFKPHRRQTFINNIINLLPPIGNTLVNQALINDKLSLYPNYSYEDYIRVKDGGFNADYINSTFDIANTLSDMIVNNQQYYGPLLNWVGSDCSAASSNIDNISFTCLNSFIHKIAKLSFGRTVEAGKLTQLKNIATEAFNMGDKRSAIAGSIIALILNPEFYFYMDAGGADLGNNVYEKSTPGMLRSLSVMLTNTYPDEQAINIAEGGTGLTNQANYNTVINHLMQRTDGQGRNLAALRVYDALKEYLDLDKNSGFGSSNEMLLGLLPDYIAKGVNVNQTVYGTHGKDGAAADARLLYFHIAENNSTSEQLLTLPVVVALNPLQKYVTGAATTDPNPQYVNSRPARGIALSNRYMYGGTKFYRNPFTTADKWLKIFLCEEMGNPDPNNFPPIAFEPPPLDPDKTIREVYEERTNLPACISCHDKMNPVAFALDSINAVAEETELENFYNSNGQYVSTNTKDTYTELEIKGQYIQAINAFDLRDKMKNLKTFELCLAKKVTAYTYQTKQVSDKGCSVTNSFKALTNDNRPLKELFKTQVEWNNSNFRKLYFDPQ
jgi:hypothetical protein